MKTLNRWWRDWRRGYTDADIQNMILKSRRGSYPGAIVFLSPGECKAFTSMHYWPHPT